VRNFPGEIFYLFMRKFKVHSEWVNRQGLPAFEGKIFILLLYDFTGSVNGYKARLMLGLLDVPYDIIENTS